MCYFFVRIQIYQLIGSLYVLSIITAQDSKVVPFFPNTGNNSSTELAGKIIDSTFNQDNVQDSSVHVSQELLPPSYYLPVQPSTIVHHRSENYLPYAFEYPHIGYPVVQNIEQPIAPTSKQLVIVSFIGLLLLLAIIQNTFASTKRKDGLIDVLSSKRKRDLHSTYDFVHTVIPEEKDDEDEEIEEEIVLNDDARVRCIQRTICLENHKLIRDLGLLGKLLAKYLTRNVERSFKSSIGWDRLIDDAGSAGIRGENCDLLYRDCEIPINLLSSMGEKKFDSKDVTSIKNSN